MTGSAKVENRVTRKIMDLRNLSIKEIQVALQSDNTKHMLFQFISWPIIMERFQNLSPGIAGKVLSD